MPEHPRVSSHGCCQPQGPGSGEKPKPCGLPRASDSSLITQTQPVPELQESPQLVETLLHTARCTAASYSRQLQLQLCAYLTFRCPRGGRGRALQSPCLLLEGSKDQQTHFQAHMTPGKALLSQVLHVL